MKATAVIGANFGDEGKGLMVDYLVSRAEGGCIVVRHNGGAQAGHTVVTPEGRRHVFHHFGSGSLLGAATYLSRFFVVNPMVWKKERDELRQLGVDPPVYVDPSAPLTTPYDMLINQEVERIRGATRHGSCGLGIHETIVRNATALKTTVGSADLRELCQEIRANWALKRLSDLSPEPPSKLFLERLHSDNILENYLADRLEFLLSTRPTLKVPARSNVIFEGAQGLLLDEDHPFFPHVTHSKTGLRNVLALCEEAGIDSVEAVYVTRAYMTRHGAGPFPTENPGLSYPDTTNAPNEFQGSLRFGDLDPVALQQEITRDLWTGPKTPSEGRQIRVYPKVAVTCLDQVPDPQAVLSGLLGAGHSVEYGSGGPRRSDVVPLPSFGHNYDTMMVGG